MTPAAERMRRLRERRARGARVVAVEIDVDLLAAFDELGLVDPDDPDDPGALAFALLMLLEEAIESRKKISDASRVAPGLL
jgi:hypothetical protein